MKHLKLFLSLFIFVFFTFFSYSLTNINDCSQDPSVAGETYVLNSSLAINGSTCLSVSVSDIILDCQNYQISGNQTGYAIDVAYKNNITIKNCIISNFSTGIRLYSSDYSSISNVKINNSLGTGLLVSTSSDYNTLSSIEIENGGSGIYLVFGISNNSLSNIKIINHSSYGIWIDGGANSNNTLTDIYISDSANYGLILDGYNGKYINLKIEKSYRGIYLKGSNNTIDNLLAINNSNSGVGLTGSASFNKIINSKIMYNYNGLTFYDGVYNNTIQSNTIKFNTNYNIFFDYWSLFPTNTTFTSNYLGNSSLIGAHGDWANYTNTIFSSNYYSDYNGTGNICFPGVGILCDSNPLQEVTQIQSSSNIFPFFSFSNQLITLFFLSIWFLKV